MRSVEKSGKTVDQAIRAALDELKLEPNQVKVTILDEGSRGILGLGSRPATVKVMEKEFYADAAPAVKQTPVKSAPVKSVKPVPAKPAAPVKSEKADSGKPEKVIASKPAINAPATEIKPEIASIAHEEFVEGNPKDIETAKSFLNDLFAKMGLTVEMDFKCTVDKIFIDLKGDDMGIIIGKRGETLDAVQYLTSLVVNKNRDEYVKIAVDTENYRAKREETLKKLAVRLANKALSNKRKVTLEPMNAAERRIIHAELQNFAGVTTYSIGNDPARKVVIAPQR